MLHSGIDLHKRTVAIATVDSAGRPVRDVQLPAKREVLTRDFAALPGGAAGQRAVVESTATWYWLRDLVLAARPGTGCATCLARRVLTSGSPTPSL